MTPKLTDNEILSIVHSAIESAIEDGENWPHYVDSALADAGVQLSEDQLDGSDQREIVRLADGRTVTLWDESAKGADRYGFEE